MKTTPPRCSYCKRTATVWFHVVSSRSSRGYLKASYYTVAVCEDHESCDGWATHRSLHADAPLIRANLSAATR